MTIRKTLAALLAALALMLVLPPALAAEAPVVALGDGAPIPYLEGFSSRLIKDPGQLSGISGETNLSWQQANNIGAGLVSLTVENIALTPDILAVFYRAEFEKPPTLHYGTASKSYELAAPYLSISLNGDRLPVMDHFCEGYPEGDRRIHCLRLFSLEAPLPDQAVLTFHADYNSDTRQHDSALSVQIDQSRASDPTVGHDIDLPISLSYHRTPGQKTDFQFTIKRVSFGPFGNRIHLIIRDSGQDSGILSLYLKDDKGRTLPIWRMRNITHSLASPLNPVDMHNEIWFFGGEDAESLALVPIKTSEQTTPTLPFYSLAMDSAFPVTLPLENGSSLTVKGVQVEESGFTISYTASIAFEANFRPGDSQGQELRDLYYVGANSYDLPSETLLAQGLWMSEYKGQPIKRVSEKELSTFTSLLVSSYAQKDEMPVPELMVTVPLK
ncbi:MAG: hypothetical protein GX540_03285 [Clostridiales bacterium]|nr:hypothetical protein [Clostridiales bacterium]